MIDASPFKQPQKPTWRALTAAQEGIWYAQSLDPGNPIFNTGHCTEIRGVLNISFFSRAINLTLQEADALGLRCRQTEQGPEQCILPERLPELEIIDLQDQAQALLQAQSLMDQDLRTPVDPDTQRLARHVLFILHPEHVLWYQRVHHLAADGYGMALIEGRVVRIYHALQQGQNDLGPALDSLSQVQEQDAAYRQSPQYHLDQSFWLEHLKQADPALSLVERTALSDHHCLLDRSTASEQLIQALQSRAGQSQVSWPDLITALSAVYIKRHTRQNPCTVGVPFMGRLGNGSARVVATVMNVMPVVLSIDEDAPLNQFLVESSKTLRKARRHGQYRSEQLRRDLGLLGGLQRLHGPIVNILPFDTPYELAGLQAKQTVLCAGPVEDLNITFRARADGADLRLELEANPKLYTPLDLQTHRRRLHEFLLQALGCDTLANVPTLTSGEHQRWIYEVNDSAHPVPAHTLWDRIEIQLHQQPDALALEDAEQKLTYAQLNHYTQALAAQLQDAGINAGDIVAVALPRSIELVLSILSLCRLGAVYLPLDIHQPHERLAGILRVSQARLLIHQGSLRFNLPSLVPNLAYTRRFLGPCPATSAHPAYLLYTSGSTGEPKGVLVNHSAIVNRLLWMQAHYEVSCEDRILQKTPASFDVSVWEFFLPFLAGASLFVAPPEAHRDPAQIARLIREQHISILHFVPSMLAAFLEEPLSQGLSPRLVFCSGEELPAGLRDRFHHTIQAELHNLYGPTEAAVDVSYWPATAQDRSQPVPIGYPVWNTALYVLDEYLRPVPPNVAGDLYLAGRQLAQGYWRQPALTEERFIPDPYQVHGTRMYATGDIARWRTDGALVFLGRSDHQIKLRGQRIELGEIEAVLAAYPGIAQLVVIASQDVPGRHAIVAYAVATPGTTPDSQAVLAFGAQKLPDYMLPAALMWIDRLPVTPNGKLDRKALPTPFLNKDRAGAPLQGPMQEFIAAHFQTILDRAGPIYADDDFFSLGGHSLLAARLALNLRTHLKIDVSIGSIFEYPTVARLARHLSARTQANPHQNNDGFEPVFTLRHATRATLPALFTIHPAGGLCWCYGQLARQLPPGRAIYGLQAHELSAPGHQAIPSLRSMASQYVDLMQQLQKHGPYHLAGWSVGGIIAQAMAVELHTRGQEVGLLALMDAYPGDAWREQDEPAPDAVYKALLHIAGYDPASLPNVELNRTSVIAFLQDQAHPLASLPPERLNAIFQLVASNNQLVRQHFHTRYEGQALYLRAALDHQASPLHPDMWTPYIAQLEVHDIPSLHAHLTGAQATEFIAPLMQAHMQAKETATLDTQA